MVDRGKKIYFATSAQALLGGTSVRMIDHPKEASLRENHWVHALRVERESIYTVAGKKCYGRLRNETNLPVSGKGECCTNLVVGKYAQTRQRRLRGKVVKHWSRQAL